jgi:hypothetical protein
MRVPRWFLLLVCSLLLVACGQASPTSLTARDAVPSATPSYGPVTRSEACPSVQPQHLPRKLSQIRRAYVCVYEIRSVPGDGKWMFDVVNGVTGGFAQLLTAYGTADAHPTSGGCTTELPDALVVYLDTDRSFAVRAPRDPCSKPTAAGRKAYEGLNLQEVTAIKLSRVTS